MANSFQKLADILNIENARLSGDPRRLQVASQMQETKELKQANAQSEAEINKAIDESNLPESQKRLLKALSLKEKAALFLETQKPKKGLTPNEMVKMEEAKVLQKLKILNGDITKLTPYEKNIYDNYVKGGSINPFMEALAKQIGGGSTATPPPASKTYTVTSGIYKGDSADSIINNAKNLNPQLTREQVIENLISQGIIAEG
jgi:hypothetical protein